MLRIDPNGHGYFVNRNSGKETSIEYNKLRNFGFLQGYVVAIWSQNHTWMNLNHHDRKAVLEININRYQIETCRAQARKNINALRTNSEELARLIANSALILGTLGFFLVAIGVLKHLRII